MNNFKRSETGRFINSMNPTNFELGPYGEMEIAQQNGTVALVNCDLPRINLVVGGDVTPLNLHSSLPVNAHVVKIRNPYGILIRGQLLFDLPPQLNGRTSEQSLQFAERASWYITADVELNAEDKTGFTFIAKRGEHRVFITGHNTAMRVYILPKANAEMLGVINDSQMTNQLSPFYSNGEAAANIVGRYGAYKDWMISEWMRDAEWQQEPLAISYQDASIAMRCDEETGIFVSYDEGSVKPRFSVHGYDVGENK